jgi:uncharacterized membrane protein YidH (DUF202 family)
MIEMQQDGESLGDDDFDDDDWVAPQGPFIAFVRRLFAPPSLAIAGFALGIANLTFSRLADTFGEIRLASTISRRTSNLTELRPQLVVQLIVAGLALAMAATALARLRGESDPDEEDPPPADPVWLRGVGGAGVIVGILGTVLCIVALVYATRVHASPIFSGLPI